MQVKRALAFTRQSYLQVVIASLLSGQHRLAAVLWLTFVLMLHAFWSWGRYPDNNWASYDLRLGALAACGQSTGLQVGRLISGILRLLQQKGSPW